MIARVEDLLDGPAMTLGMFDQWSKVYSEACNGLYLWIGKDDPFPELPLRVERDAIHLVTIMGKVKEPTLPKAAIYCDVKVQGYVDTVERFYKLLPQGEITQDDVLLFFKVVRKRAHNAIQVLARNAGLKAMAV